MATIMEIKDFPTRFEMFSVYYYCSPYVPIILLEISEEKLIFVCTQDGAHQGVIESKFMAGQLK